MNYPKTVKIENDKLKKLLVEKSSLVEEGRSISNEIEKMELDMVNIDKEIQEIEKTVDISDIDKEAKELTGEYNKLGERMNEVQKKLFARFGEFVPVNLKFNYEELKKNKEEKEEERNKIGLKIQKYNDKIIPLAQKELSKYLENEYDDFETVKIDNDEIIGTIFNHLEDFKKNYKSKFKK